MEDSMGNNSYVQELLTKVAQNIPTDLRSRLGMGKRRDFDLGSLLTGIGIGLLIGASAGVLLAPQGGEESRKQLLEWIEKMSNQMFGRSKEEGEKESDDMSSGSNRNRAQPKVN